MTQENIEKLLSIEPFALSKKEKKEQFLKAMHEAFRHHFQNNELFANYCKKMQLSENSQFKSIEAIPYIPVNIFKNKKLLSVDNTQIKKVLNSSSTKGVPSTIFIDSVTAKRQAIASAKVMSHYLGSQRRPFLILDDDPMKKKSMEITARSAATRGFAVFSNETSYFINENNGELELDIEKFKETIKQYNSANNEICIFGFTYILYAHVVKKLLEQNITFKLPDNSKIIHIGGWKKLEDQKVSRQVFIENVSQVFGVPNSNILDFYGFTEQMGLVYANRGLGLKKVPVFADIIIRDFQTLKPVEDGKEGLIQILTPLPYSYPGISILTEDVGRIINRNKDEFGCEGTEFEVIGRAKAAEVRGCGDVMSEIVH
jgi:hypothetical protein